MKYACLIYHTESIQAQMSEAEINDNMNAHWAFSNEMEERGVMAGGHALHPTSTATTVRVNAEGKVVTTDGPFAETKEQLGGLYILDCADLDEAIECAAKIPEATGGCVEIRPLVIFD